MKDGLGTALARWRVRAVLPRVKGRLLDIGCGTNLLVRAYSPRGQGIGVDVHPWPGADRVVADCSRLPFPDRSFDTVAIVAALNHMANREAILREARRLLRPDGILLLTTLPPLVSRLWHAGRERHDADQAERGMAAGEVFGFTGRALRDLLAAARFEIVAQRRFMLGINRLTVARPANGRRG
jgi:ubiquinone/menaquinone biosynthesis C-methylase UbiE